MGNINKHVSNFRIITGCFKLVQYLNFRIMLEVYLVCLLPCSHGVALAASANVTGDKLSKLKSSLGTRFQH